MAVTSTSAKYAPSTGASPSGTTRSSGAGAPTSPVAPLPAVVWLPSAAGPPLGVDDAAPSPPATAESGVTTCLVLPGASLGSAWVTGAVGISDPKPRPRP